MHGLVCSCSAEKFSLVQCSQIEVDTRAMKVISLEGRASDLSLYHESRKPDVGPTSFKSERTLGKP